LDLARYLEVIPYSRFSSAKQQRGTSEERQADTAEAFALRHGVALSTRRVDRAKSGTKGENLEAGGALREVIDGIASGLIPTPCLLLIERQDRFGRLPPTTALTTLFGDLLDRGCDLYHLNSGKLYTADGINQSFGDLVTLAAEVHAAHQFSVQLIERINTAHEKARRSIAEGKPGVRPKWAPAWIGWDGQQWHLNDYAKTVERLFALVRSGKGQIQTAKALNAEGHQTPRGKVWTAGSVSHVLYSPSVAGGREVKRRSGDVNWDYFPPVIPKEQWESVLAEVAARDNAAGVHGSQGQIHWFGQGQTLCTCGRVIGYRSASCLVKGKRERKEYLRCRGAIKNQREARCCFQPALRLEVIEAHVLTRLALGHWQQLFPHKQSGLLGGLRERAAEQRAALASAKALVASAEGELTRVLAEEPSLAAVMARQVAAAELRVETVDRDYLAAQKALKRAEGDAVANDVASLCRAAKELMRAFADGTETVSDRLGLNQLLRRLEMTVTVDAAGERVGLQVGAGEIDWQPLAPQLDLAGLRRGWAETVNLTFDADQETLELLSRLPKTADDLADLGVALNEVLGTDGQALAQG
jgi:DNA invertase Pin-like site-specific DNA recombinase